MGLAAEYAFDGDGPAAALRLSGRLTLARIGDMYDDLQAALAAHGPVATIDLAGVERIDTVGAWMVERLVQSTGGRVTGASREAEILIEAVSRADEPVQMRPDMASPLRRIAETVGASARKIFGEFIQLIAFIGEAMISSVALLRHPRRIRWMAVATGVEQIGINALVIIGLMCFLIGIVSPSRARSSWSSSGWRCSRSIWSVARRSANWVC